MFSFSKFEHKYDKSVFNHVELLSEDYKVFVNGIEVPVYTCRISKYPFNGWGGRHQRDICQSEEASYVNLVSDEEIKVEVVASNQYKRVMVKPYSKGIRTEEKEGKICFTLKENGKYVLELDSYHHCLYIFNGKPIVCENKEDVTYYFGPGIYFAGKIKMKSGEKMYIDKDALVYGCVYADNAENIEIFGNGILDDGSEERVSIQCYEDYTNGNVKFYDCKNLKIRGVGMKNSAIWCVNLFHCFDVEIDGISVFGQWRYNTDGIDIVNCQRIEIKNSFVHSFDDTITVKGIDRYRDTDNKHIHIENCVLWCDWGRTCEIGLETSCNEYSDISFRNCDILRAGTVACDIQNGDYAEVHDILFEDIRVEYNSFDTEEIMQTSEDMKYEAENIVKIPFIFFIINHRFREMYTDLFKGEGPVPYPENTGYQQACCHDITLRNVNIYYDEGVPKRDNGQYDVRIALLERVKDVHFYNIVAENICVNGTRLTREDINLSADRPESIKIL